MRYLLILAMFGLFSSSAKAQQPAHHYSINTVSKSDSTVATWDFTDTLVTHGKKHIQIYETTTMGRDTLTYYYLTGNGSIQVKYIPKSKTYLSVTLDPKLRTETTYLVTTKK